MGLAKYILVIHIQQYAREKTPHTHLKFSH